MSQAQNVVPSHDELMAIINRQNAEIEALKASKVSGKITLKVSDKGALSVYGLGRFPVTLYRSQWERLIGEIDNVRKFIAANVDSLKTKDA